MNHVTHLFLLSKENISLAAEEVLSLVEKEDWFLGYSLDENVLVLKESSDSSVDVLTLSRRLAYTQSIYSLITFIANDGVEYSNQKMLSAFRQYMLEKGKYSEDALDFGNYLKYKFESVELLPHYKESFSFKKVKLSNDNAFPMSEKDFSSEIFRRLRMEKDIRDHFRSDHVKEKMSLKRIVKAISGKKDPRPVSHDDPIQVNLDEPGTRFELLVGKELSYLCKFEYDCDKGYNERNTQFLPARHPSSMKARLSRGLVNLTGLTVGQTLLDPFCGIGTCLIEGGFMGLRIAGSDIDQEMLDRAKINLDYFGFRCKLKRCDARDVEARCDAIVADLPYGKNTKDVPDLDKLAIDFLNHAYDLCDVVVVGFPDFCDSDSILRKTPWKIKYEFKYYLHKSLSKRICKLVKK